VGWHQAKIQGARTVYNERVCDRLAILFTCLTDMESISPVYQFSLPFFLSSFQTALAWRDHTGDAADDPAPVTQEQRVRDVNARFVLELHANVTPCMTQAHQFLFALRVCLRLLQRDELVTAEEVR
jgi:dynein heavy chain